jgi:U4/U6 small nuclear ribonucleoprotein PRP3
VSWFATDKTSKQTNAPCQSTANLLAQKRAEIAAKFAAMGLKAPGGAASPVKPVSTPALPPISLPAKPAATPSVALPDPAELARRVVEAKRRVAEATTKAAMSANPYIVSDRNVAYASYRHTTDD